jgi:geranylgeranyl diphosphate synthase, type I
VGEVRALSLAPSAQPLERNPQSWSDPAQFDVWRIGLRRKVLTHLTEFVTGRCAAELDESGVEVAGDVLMKFVAGGKCLRSTFMYLGWLAGAQDSDEALFASAGLELLPRRAAVVRPHTSNSANGIEIGSCPAPRGDSANRRRSCWAISV